MCFHGVSDRDYFSVALILFTVFYASNVSAQDQQKEDLEKPIAGALKSLGYESVEIRQCELRFSVKLDNSCPSDRAIGFDRIIKLQHIPEGADFVVEPIASTRGRVNVLRFNPVRPYFSAAGLRYSTFRLFVEAEFPESGWPWRFNAELPKILSHFREEFDDLESFSFWEFRTCFGVSYGIDTQIGFSGTSPEKPGVLGNALQEYRSSANCQSD